MNAGRKVEKNILRKIKAHPQPNSGAIPGMPNDGVKGRFLIEVKSTEKNSISVKYKSVLELGENALMRGKTPALLLAFHVNVLTGPIEEWVAVPLRDFERLTKNWTKF